MSILDQGQFAYVIRGGRPIHGTLVPGGNKNAALPMLAATLLADGTVELANVPQIRDAAVMLELLSELGAGVEKMAPSTWRIDGSTVASRPVPERLACEIRASFLLAGPLLARFGRAVAPSCRAREATVSAADRSMPTFTHFRRSAPTSRSDRKATG
jgi:UDP-N-acetylglucosamine 1-carboxyvinyltransferase